MAQENSSSPSSSNAILIVLYWAIVGVPLCWGIYKTVQKSTPLFQASSAQTVGTPAATATATPAPAVKASPTPAAIDAAPAASPFSTVQPSATVGPVTTPVAPGN